MEKAPPYTLPKPKSMSDEHRLRNRAERKRFHKLSAKEAKRIAELRKKAIDKANKLRHAELALQKAKLEVEPVSLDKKNEFGL